MREDSDLQEVFQSFDERLKNLEEQIKSIDLSPIQKNIEETQNALSEIEKRVTGLEQVKPYGKPYGAPFINAVVALLRKIGAPEEVIKKVQALKAEELKGVVPGEEEGTEKGEEQYPAPTVAKVLRYLERQIGTQWTKRKFNYIIRLLGAKAEEWVVPPATHVLPSGEELSGEDFDKYVEEQAERFLKFGREHQE